MDKYLTDKIYWERRVKYYDKLQWAKRENYIKAFIKMCQPNKEDFVLDLGTGTGIMAYSLARLVRIAVGIDSSMAMLRQAQKHNSATNVYFLRGDVRYLPFLDNIFTKVTARMVFHYLLTGLNKSISETYRVLKPGGSFCLSEGVPPDRCVEDFYKAIFKLKEKRRTFFPEDLEKLMIKGGFKKIKKKEFIMRHCSIKNWLENAGNLSYEVRNKIFDMHIQLHDEGKKVYNMKITPNDCFIDMNL